MITFGDVHGHEKTQVPNVDTAYLVHVPSVQHGCEMHQFIMRESLFTPPRSSTYAKKGKAPPFFPLKSNSGVSSLSPTNKAARRSHESESGRGSRVREYVCNLPLSNNVHSV